MQPYRRSHAAVAIANSAGSRSPTTVATSDDRGRVVPALTRSAARRSGSSAQPCERGRTRTGLRSPPHRRHLGPLNDEDEHVRSHSGAQPSVGIVDIEHDVVGHDVLCRLRRVAVALFCRIASIEGPPWRHVPRRLDCSRACSRTGHVSCLALWAHCATSGRAAQRSLAAGSPSAAEASSADAGSSSQRCSSRRSTSSRDPMNRPGRSGHRSRRRRIRARSDGGGRVRR